MIVLIGCEESQTITKAFRKRGIEAYSNDLKPCSGGKPEWHLQMDVFKAVDLIRPTLAIFHPPCERLTIACNRWFKPEYAERFPNIKEEREEAVTFFLELAALPIKYRAIENPVGIMSSRFEKPQQIFHPYHFGDAEAKKTCLWLKNLPLLKHTNIVAPEFAKTKEGEVFKCTKGFKDSPTHYRTLMIKDTAERRRQRSITYNGISEAMAEQWSNFLHF